MDDEEIVSRSSGVLNTILKLQYATQHFGFHPRTFLDSVYNIFFENIYSCLNQMSQHMNKEYGEILPPNLIKAQTDSLLQELVKRLDNSIDKLEVYLHANLFLIEKHVILPEDEVHIKCPCTKEEDEKLDAEIKELQQKILQEKARRFTLKKKIIEQKEVREELLFLQGQLKTLLGIAYQNEVTPESIKSLYSDLTKLTDLNFSPVKRAP